MTTWTRAVLPGEGRGGWSLAEAQVALESAAFALEDGPVTPETSWSAEP